MFQIVIRTEGNATVVELSGRLEGSLKTEDRDRVAALVKPKTLIILDLSKLQQWSGAGLRRLLNFSRFVNSQGAMMTARGLSQRMEDLAEASGFRQLFSKPAPFRFPETRVSARVRTDLYPTLSYGSYALRPGNPLQLGATPVSNGVNFAVFSRHATSCTLVLFEPGIAKPMAEIPIPQEFRIGDVWAMTVFDLEPEDFEYGFRMDGPFEPSQGHRFDHSKILRDPFARAIVGQSVWGEKDRDLSQVRCKIVPDDFDWEGDLPLGTPFQDLVIYEMHVRGFTQSPSSRTHFPGTYAAIREKIPHLVELGINCVEFLPIFEFDEMEVDRVNPLTGERLVNYWGYSTSGFFAPNAAYAATGEAGLQADEFRTLVKELHRNGIEVILDVVFNHTAEGNEHGPTLSFRGLDNRVYYMLTHDGHYYNFSGCGNTLNCNHPVVRDFVIACLRHWVADYHVDGFRFDLASILGRSQDGTPLGNPPLLEALALDPVLGRTKLIAEAWDAGGLYQVGNFPAYGRFAEWNGKFRDCARQFLKGDWNQAGEMAQRLQGSPDLYYFRGPTASINFLTCHDGFTLTDLVSYNDKHNEANGEENRDGANDNHSWNCGAEGPTDDPVILALRQRQARNALGMLLLSQGVPMLLMGDEMGQTQRGNNNTYCQDNEISWLDWSLLETHRDLYRFVRLLIAFRRAHPALRHPKFLSSTPSADGTLEISFHGTQAWSADVSSGSRVLAVMVRLRKRDLDDCVYFAFNMHWDALPFEIPACGFGRWHLFANTSAPAPGDIHELGKEPALEEQKKVVLGGRSLLILVAR